MKKLEKNDIFRFALFLGESQAKNFNTNLLKMVELILFDEYGKYLSCNDIISAIQKRFLMEFCSNEIYDAIKKDKKGMILEYDKKYTLSPKRYKQITEKEETNKIENIADKFIKDNGLDYDISYIDDLIQKYIYYKFNSDITTLSNLINPRENKIEILTDDFNDAEKEILNNFFNWDYDIKNEWLFGIISSCLQYCMMSLKANTYISDLIFNGKTFYLDANIIFRLAGFNKEERKNSILTFINRCKQCGIKLKYTNFTRKEIFDTIKSFRQSLERTFNGNEPLKPQYIEKINAVKYDDIYSIFFEWTKKDQNNYNDYNKFERYLMDMVLKSLNGIELVNFDTHKSIKNTAAFDDYVDDLKNFTLSRNKNKTDSAAIIDIENYLYISELSKNEIANNFIDKKSFFISADHIFIDWTMNKVPGSIPIFVLPSIWYSIILQYGGRNTKDDYSTFCNFLRLNQSNNNMPFQEEMRKAGKFILGLNESAEIKEEIIIRVEQQVYEKNKENLTEQEIYNVVKDSHEYITDRETRFAQDNIYKKIAKDNVKKNKKIIVVIKIILIIVCIVSLFLLYRINLNLEFFNNNLIWGIIGIIYLIITKFFIGVFNTVFNTDIKKEYEKVKNKHDTQ